ncbi:MAG TPA: hypothetical protein VFS10_12875 [Pyrinomonadaceae bacterium]|nr:hypothetical protein [Pyrinomonadaceae bacterium]
MLFGSNILEIALAMIFVYLLMSLLCSAVAEYIEAKRNFRAKDLERGIRLLLDPQEQEGRAGATPLSKDESVAGRLYNHPLVKSLYRGEKLPSYIPSRTFALALWDMAFPADVRPADGGDTHNLATIRQAVRDNQVVSEEVKTALLALIDDAGGNFDKARANIEEWFDSSMDRVSGWYKRRVHFFLLLIGFGAAALINVDTINIARALATNETLRKGVVAVAEKAAEDESVAGIPLAAATPATTPTPAPTPRPAANANSNAGAVSTPAPAATRTPATATNANQPTPRATTTAGAAESPDEAARKITALRGQLDQLGLPVGWVRAKTEMQNGREVITNANDPRRFPDSVWGWLLKVIGLAITALAISQGAPFWFDLLNKIIVIRSTVKPREKSPTQPSKDMPAPDTTTGKS